MTHPPLPLVCEPWLADIEAKTPSGKESDYMLQHWLLQSLALQQIVLQYALPAAGDNTSMQL